jgi:uncharacterized delta-60 repeat protein
MKKSAALIASSLFAFSPLLSGAPDTVDPNFASTAGQVFDPSDFGGISSVLVQPDGRILFGSNEMSAHGGTKQISLIRFHPDGALDTDFFSDNDPEGRGTGIFFTDPGWPEGHALGLQSDGKIIAAGTMQGMDDGTNTFTSNSIVRINPSGTVDTSFQTSGTVPWPTGGFNYIEDVTVMPDDKIYCVGAYGGFRSPGFIQRYGIARINADGSVDTGFQINPAEFGVPAGVSNLRGFFTQASPDGSGDVYVVGSLERGPAFPIGGSV